MRFMKFALGGGTEISAYCCYNAQCVPDGIYCAGAGCKRNSY